MSRGSIRESCSSTRPGAFAEISAARPDKKFKNKLEMCHAYGEWNVGTPVFPHAFTDPIQHTPLVSPYIASDGRTYDITSLTRAPNHPPFYFNRAAAAALQEWVEWTGSWASIPSNPSPGQEVITTIIPPTPSSVPQVPESVIQALILMPPDTPATVAQGVTISHTKDGGWRRNDGQILESLTSTLSTYAENIRDMAPLSPSLLRGLTLVDTNVKSIMQPHLDQVLTATAAEFAKTHTNMTPMLVSPSAAVQHSTGDLQALLNTLFSIDVGQSVTVLASMVVCLIVKVPDGTYLVMRPDMVDNHWSFPWTIPWLDVSHGFSFWINSVPVQTLLAQSGQVIVVLGCTPDSRGEVVELQTNDNGNWITKILGRFAGFVVLISPTEK